MPRLCVFLDARQVNHELTAERITIGRGPENLIQISDLSVSASHAQLELIAGHYELRDLGSTNGTSVNGKQVTEVFLRAGDRIEFGNVEARFETGAVEPAQLLPEVELSKLRPASRSEKPEDFANASPYPRSQKKTDPFVTAVITLASLALVAFVIAMVALLQMHGTR